VVGASLLDHVREPQIGRPTGHIASPTGSRKRIRFRAGRFGLLASATRASGSRSCCGCSTCSSAEGPGGVSVPTPGSDPSSDRRSCNPRSET
jgi:hypothetical protein